MRAMRGSCGVLLCAALAGCFSSHQPSQAVAGGAGGGGGAGGSGGGSGSSGRPTFDDGPPPDSPFEPDPPNFDPPPPPPPVVCTDVRPPAVVEATWQDAALALGSPGWRDSTGALCGRDVQIAHMWADDTGVYTSVTERGGGGGCARGVYFNDGAGWSKLDAPALGDPGRIDRMPGGNLISWAPGSASGVQELVNGAWITTLDEPVSSLHVSGDGVVHAVAGLTWDARFLHRFRDGVWTRLADPPPVGGAGHPGLGAVWGSARRAFVTGTHVGTMFRFQDGQWSLEQTDSAQVFSHIFGVGDDDIWAGTHDDAVFREPDIFHFDGERWTGQPWGATIECGMQYPTVTGIWGTADVLYIHSGNELVRVRDGVSESLISWNCNLANSPTIASIWGTGDDDLFVQIRGRDDGRSSCNDVVLLHYDGTEFHQF